MFRNDRDCLRKGQSRLMGPTSPRGGRGSGGSLHRAPFCRLAKCQTQLCDTFVSDSLLSLRPRSRPSTSLLDPAARHCTWRRLSALCRNVPTHRASFPTQVPTADAAQPPAMSSHSLSTGAVRADNPVAEPGVALTVSRYRRICPRGRFETTPPFPAQHPHHP